MRKIFKIEGLDCANCGLKIEDGIRKIDNVDNVSVNFLTQKLIIDADEAFLDDIIKKSLKIIKKVDSYIEVSEQN